MTNYYSIQNFIWYITFESYYTFGLKVSAAMTILSTK